MNNSKIAINEVSFFQVEELDLKPRLRQKETELVEIIEAINAIAESKEWKVLKEKIFDGVVESLKRQRDSEVEKKPLNGPVIHSLNGQLAWAKKYSDFSTLAHIYKLELENIRKKLHAKND